MTIQVLRAVFDANLRGIKTAARVAVSTIRTAGAQLGAGISAIGRSIKRLTKWVAVGLAAAGGALLYLTHRVASIGDDFAKMSKRVGISVEDLSALAFAAERSGTSIQAIETGIRRFQRAATEASQGVKEYAETFERYNVAVTDNQGKVRATRELFLDVADVISQMTNETERAAVAQELFGRSGTALLPMFREGRDGIAALMEKAKELGIVWSQEDAEAAEEFKDRLSDLKAAFGGLTKEIGTVFMPVLTKAFDILAQFVSRTVQIVKTDTKKIFDVMMPIFSGGLTILFELVSGVAETLWTPIEVALEITWANIKSLFNRGVIFIVQYGNEIARFWEGVGHSIMNALASAVAKMFELLGEALFQLNKIEIFKGIFDKELLLADKKLQEWAGKIRQTNVDTDTEVSKSRQERLTRITELEKEAADEREQIGQRNAQAFMDITERTINTAKKNWRDLKTTVSDVATTTKREFEAVGLTIDIGETATAIAEGAKTFAQIGVAGAKKIVEILSTGIGIKEKIIDVAEQVVAARTRVRQLAGGGAPREELMIARARLQVGMEKGRMLRGQLHGLGGELQAAGMGALAPGGVPTFPTTRVLETLEKENAGFRKAFGNFQGFKKALTDKLGEIADGVTELAGQFDDGERDVNRIRVGKKR